MSIRYTLNGAPYLVTVTNGPSSNLQAIHFDGGVFAQDQWRLGRFTINLGLRWDHFNAGVPAQTNPAGYFTQAVTTPEITDTPNFNDWATRTGVAWDVFGDGKTAVRAFAGRFVGGHALDITSQANPIYLQTDTRSWTDDGERQATEAGVPLHQRHGGQDAHLRVHGRWRESERRSARQPEQPPVLRSDD